MKPSRVPLVSVILPLFTIIISCSGGNSGINSTTPALNPQSEMALVDSNRHLWGLWNITIDTKTGLCEVNPLRGPAFTANVNNLLESKPNNLVISELDLSNYLTQGRLDCTITLKHPFPGMGNFNGFDVWGVFLHNGASVLDYEGLTYSGGPDAGQDEAVLLNPDGFTRWFNQPEFDGNGPPLLEYWPGKLSNLPFPTAKLNPYKIFADGLGKNDNYHTWITSGNNAADRNIFRAGSSNSRRYQLDFPMKSGSPVLQFQYAVIATWEPGDPTKTGSPSVYDPGDFPSSANCEEAFYLYISTDKSSLFNDGAGASGGNFVAEIEIFDWQGGSVGQAGVMNEIHSIVLIGDFIVGNKVQVPQAQLLSIAKPSTSNSSVFEIEVTNCEPKASGKADFWVVVEAKGINGESYSQGFPAKFPSPARRAAFMNGSVEVGTDVPWPDVIFVDDSNKSGIENGTYQYPYNTIQEGIDNNPQKKEIWVDDSGVPYVENVKMLNGTILKSVNWHPADGTKRAFIDGPDVSGANSVRFDNISNAVLEGFKIGTCGVEDDEFIYMVVVNGGTSNIIRDCLFTGQTDAMYVEVISATNSTDLKIQNCRFDNLDKIISDYGCQNYYLIKTASCPELKILNNIFTKIRPTEDEGSKHGFLCYIENSNGTVLRNNLIHHASPLAGVGYMGAILLEGFRFQNCKGITVINNTVDSLDVTEAFFIQQVFAYRFDDCTDVIFKNNMATRLYCKGWPPPLARGVMGVNTNFTCSFCNVWEIGPGVQGQAYWGGATPDATCISVNPLYIDSENEKYDINPASPAQMGDPTIVDWDDTGTPSNDPSNTDTNKRSRMGCYGGPYGQYVGLIS